MALDLGIFLEGSQSTFKVKVSDNDSQAQFLLDKLTSSDGSVTITETNDGGIETIDLVAGGGSPLTTKGDLFTYSTADARLGVGTDGQALIADSAEATGLKWGTISTDNMATADLTLTADRDHNLDGNGLTFKTSSPAAGYLGIRNSETASGVECLKIWSEISPRYTYINNIQNSLFLGGNADIDQLELANGFAKYKTRVSIIPDGPVGDAYLQVRGFASGATTKVFLVEDNGGAEAFRITNDKQTYAKRLNITGTGGTSATTALLVENSVGADALEIRNDSVIIMANLPTSSAGLPTGAIWNNSGVLNVV